MKKNPHIQGRILPSRPLTSKEETIFENRLATAGIIRLGRYTAPAGVIDFNEDDSQDTHWIPDYDSLQDNNGDYINLANALEQAMNAPGLEGVSWSGELLVVAQYKKYPVVYRIIVSDNTAIRLYAQIRWNPPIPLVVPWDLMKSFPAVETGALLAAGE